MRVLDLLNSGEQEKHFGREQELSELRELLSFERDWKLIHVFGPGGVGKTTLLEMYAQSAGVVQCFLFDGHIGFRTPQDWLRKLRELMDTLESVKTPLSMVNEECSNAETKALADRLNALAVKRGGLVLLFDTFEQWTPIEDWLCNEWLPLLDFQVRICSAGRYPLEGPWTRGGWSRLVRNVKLNPLSMIDFNRYLSLHGIDDPLIREKLRKFTGCMPLAMSLAIEIIRRKKTPDFLDASEQYHTVSRLIEELLRDLGNPDFQRYLDVASVLWRFNQEWLQVILGEPVHADTFREFCRLPFIITCEDGWGLHDSIRNWTRSDFHRRQPQTLESYRNKALNEYRLREKLNPAIKSLHTIDKLYLHQNDLVRYYCFSGEVEGLKVKTCQAEDVPRMEELYLEYGKYKGAFFPGESGFLPILKPLWQEDPNGFIGLWKNGVLSAFYNFITLNENTDSLLKHIGIHAPYLTQSERIPREYAFCFVGLDPRLEEELGGALTQHMVHQFNKADILVDITPLQEWFPVLEYIGFEPIPWADSYIHGVQHKAFLLDLRTEDYATKLDRMFTANSGTDQISASILTAEEAYSSAKQLLNNYHYLEKNPEFIAFVGSHMKINSALLTVNEYLPLIQEQTDRVLNLMDSGIKEEQTFGRILRLAYIQKIGSHEMVAERLKIPQATYYRHLRKGITRFAELLLGKT